MAQKTKPLDKNDLWNFGICHLMTSDRRTDRWADGPISNSIDPRMLYTRGSMKAAFNSIFDIIEHDDNLYTKELSKDGIAPK